MKIGLVSMVALAALALSQAAYAQAPTSTPTPSPPPATAAASAGTSPAGDYSELRVDGNQVVTFGGDALPGDTNSVYGFTVRRPPGVLRANLIRPRVNFVSELLKSVENL